MKSLVDMVNDEHSAIAIVHFYVSKPNTRWAFTKPVEVRLQIPRDKWDQFQTELRTFLAQWEM